METSPIQQGFSLRLATLDDAEVLLNIYAPCVATAATFEYDVPSVEEFRGRIEERLGIYPYLVLEHGGVVVGYAYASRYKTRAAYQWDVELSVYLSESCRGKRCGSRLYAALIEILEIQGIRNVFGIVGMPNVQSQRLHESLGFTQVGAQLRAGYKCGAWHDVLIFQKCIGSFAGAPQPIIPIKELDSQIIRTILSRVLS